MTKLYISSDLPYSVKNAIRAHDFLLGENHIFHAKDFLLQRSSISEVTSHINFQLYNIVVTKSRILCNSLEKHNCTLLKKILIENDLTTKSLNYTLQKMNRQLNVFFLDKDAKLCQLFENKIIISY